MKTSMNLDLKKLSVQFKKYGMPVMRHFYFAFVMLLILSVGACIYMVADTFSASDEDYRLQKEQEFANDVRLKRDDMTVDKVLQLETANTGPIQPNYVPSRDNPFKE